MRRFGFTQVDILASLACAAVVIAVGSVVLASDGHGQRTQSMTVKDGTHLKLIHQSLVVFAREFGGIFARPGLVNRLPDPQLQQEIPGRGPEDPAANTTANLYSVLIMTNYFGTELPISPVERNPKVSVKQEYDYEKYDPVNDSYWDATFAADLETGSNTSYAHLVMFGTRLEQQWRDSMDAAYIVLGNRGPLGGEPDGRSHTSNPHGGWQGHVVFNDNSTEMAHSFTPDRQKKREVEDDRVPDNIFAMEDGPVGGDSIVTFTKSISDDGPVLQHD